MTHLSLPSLLCTSLAMSPSPSRNLVAQSQLRPIDNINQARHHSHQSKLTTTCTRIIIFFKPPSSSSPLPKKKNRPPGCAQAMPETRRDAVSVLPCKRDIPVISAGNNRASKRPCVMLFEGPGTTDNCQQPIVNLELGQSALPRSHFGLLQHDENQHVYIQRKELK